VANDYCTTAEIQAATPDANWGSGYDTLLAALATRASRAIDLYTHRGPGAYYVSADETRYFDGNGKRELWIDELAAAPTTVSVAESGDLTDYTDWASTDFIMWPYNALLAGEPYIRIDVDQLNGTKQDWSEYPKAVKIVGHFGYATAIPDLVKQVSIIQSVRWLKRGQQGFRDVGAIIELGQLRYAQALDPDLAALIDHLRRL